METPLRNRKKEVLILDAPREFKSGRARNELLPEHAEHIYRWYRDFKDVEGVAKVVTLDDISGQGYNRVRARSNYRTTAEPSTPPRSPRSASNCIGLCTRCAHSYSRPSSSSSCWPPRCLPGATPSSLTRSSSTSPGPTPSSPSCSSATPTSPPPSSATPAPTPMEAVSFRTSATIPSASPSSPTSFTTSAPATSSAPSSVTPKTPTTSPSPSAPSLTTSATPSATPRPSTRRSASRSPRSPPSTAPT